MAKTANHVGRRYAVIFVIIGPGPHWFHELLVALSSGCRFTRSHIVLLTARALLFTLFSAQFLVNFLSNGGDRGLRELLLRQYGFDVCLFVCL